MDRATDELQAHREKENENFIEEMELRGAALVLALSVIDHIEGSGPTDDYRTHWNVGPLATDELNQLREEAETLRALIMNEDPDWPSPESRSGGREGT